MVASRRNPEKRTTEPSQLPRLQGYIEAGWPAPVPSSHGPRFDDGLSLATSVTRNDPSVRLICAVRVVLPRPPIAEFWQNQSGSRRICQAAPGQDGGAGDRPIGAIDRHSPPTHRQQTVSPSPTSFRLDCLLRFDLGCLLSPSDLAWRDDSWDRPPRHTFCLLSQSGTDLV